MVPEEGWLLKIQQQEGKERCKGEEEQNVTTTGFSEQLRWSESTWLLHLHPLDHLSSEHWFYMMSYMKRSGHRRSVTLTLYVTLNKKKKAWKEEECGKRYFSAERASTKADINGKILQRRELNVSTNEINCSENAKCKCDRFQNNIVNKTGSYRITCRWHQQF